MSNAPSFNYSRNSFRSIFEMVFKTVEKLHEMNNSDCHKSNAKNS
jgi:hypothetical protein